MSLDPQKTKREMDGTKRVIGEENDLEPYFSYYSRQCHAFTVQRGRFLAARTHQDLANIISDFADNLDRQAIRSSIVGRLHPMNPSFNADNELEELLDRTIDLAARLFLMIEIGTVPDSISPAIPLKWMNGTIRQFTRHQFDIPPQLPCTGVKLPKLFNAQNLQRIGGITIRWTSDLSDHLRMVDDDERVAIFAYPSFLMLHLTSDIFPDGFINETLRTIKLLFPSTRPEVQKWIQSLPNNLDKKFSTCGSLRTELRHIERFQFWRDRLVILKEVFDEAEPKTLSQWWWDRRKRVQWYTFWIAVLVLGLGTLFGVIQCTASIIQTLRDSPTSAYSPAH
ncbi:hypothetical protein QBC38DRAFT_513396 [Podospora fimiseda]|uniref:Uncharacterized protein n=1 Tax=Podospora fimiseda TaxID=252190 RepID=A0AAN6YM28_9PEZI|nr:hypothetical protein QBC38DRAFT_513396 [Podospora fimiseda]